jgi:hypothetical protein
MPRSLGIQLVRCASQHSLLLNAVDLKLSLCQYAASAYELPSLPVAHEICNIVLPFSQVLCISLRSRETLRRNRAPLNCFWQLRSSKMKAVVLRQMEDGND